MGGNFYVRRSYRGKTGTGAWRRLKISIVDFEQVKFWLEFSTYKVKWLYQNNSFLSTLRNHLLLPYYTLIAKYMNFEVKIGNKKYKFMSLWRISSQSKMTFDFLFDKLDLNRYITVEVVVRHCLLTLEFFMHKSKLGIILSKQLTDALKLVAVYSVLIRTTDSYQSNLVI